MMENITIYIVQRDGSEEAMEIPLGVSMSLMEVLKGEGHPIEAICGGMALCATCRVEVMNPDEVNIGDACNDELDMLDTLPCNTGNCRLTCQLQISEKLHGLKVSFPQEIFV